MSDGKCEFDEMTGTYKFWHGKNDVFDSLVLGDSKTDGLARFEIQSTAALFMNPDTNLPEATDENYLVSKLPNGKFLTVSKSYDPTSYRFVPLKELREIVQEVMTAIPGSKLVTTGSIYNRRRFFYGIRLPENKGGETEVSGHKFQHSFAILHSVDGTWPLIGATSSFDPVCANTAGAIANAAMFDGENSGATVAKHTINLNIEKLKEDFIASAESNYIFAEQFGDLAKWQLDDDDATAFFAGFVGSKRAALTKRSGGIVNRLFELYKRSPGVRGESLQDVYSAITNYYTHESAGGDDKMKQWLSSEFGDAARAKQTAWQLVNEPEQYCETVKAGEDLWNSYLKED